MKRFLLMMLALGMCSISTSAQTKEYKVEDDGFEWYKLSNGLCNYGAQDRYGNLLIPIHEQQFVFYVNGYFEIHRKNADKEIRGLVDKEGHLIVPIEYRGAGYIKDNDCIIPYVGVLKDGYFGVYNIYGKCIIPVSRKYDFARPYGKDENSVFYLCKHNAQKPTKYSLCDASGKVFFSTLRPYDDFWLIKHPTSKKYALAVCESSQWYFIDKDEKILLKPHEVYIHQWPLKLQSVKDGPIRNLTQAELNTIFFSADWLDGNIEYFAHASEYPMYKIGEKPSSNSTASSNIGSNSNNNPEGGTTQTVVVEHPVDPVPVLVPVQEWQACIGCGGMGTMGCHSCGGSGTKYIGDRLHRCGLCNGQGIIPCNVCYGNKGKYVTVYR